MKRRSLSICIILFVLIQSFPCVAQYTISTPISITDGDDLYGNKSPRLALNEAGDVIVFWSRIGSEAFYISTKTEEGFSAPIQVPFGGLNPNLWSGSLGPNFASNANHIYVTFEVYGEAIYVVHSDDGGESWDDPYAAFVPPLGRRATIPTIAVNAQGQPYIAYVNTNTFEGDAYYGMVRSEDFGSSFLPEVDVSSATFGEEVCECCNGHIDVGNNGDIYIAFRNNADNLRDIWLVRSSDGGNSFENAFDVDETDWNANVCPSNGPHFSIQENEIVTAFFSGTGVSGSGVYYSSFDPINNIAGATVDLPKTSDDSFNQNRPRIAGRGDTLAIVWQEYVDGSTDIAISVSTNGSAGLVSDPFILASLPSTQQIASVIFDGINFHIVYEDAASGTVLYQSLSFNPVGISAIDPLLFEISPNPCSDSFVVTKKDLRTMEMTMTDFQGRIVRKQILYSESTRVDVNDITPGMYLVNFHNDVDVYSEFIVIQ